MKKKSMLLTLTFCLALMVPAFGAYAFSNNTAGTHQSGADMGGISSLSGKIVETMDSGGYTYVNVEKDGKKTWVAVPTMKVKVGQEVSFTPGAVMNNFTSKTLGRTFEKIVFSAGVAGQGGAVSGGAQSKTAPAADIKVDRASGPNAYTVSELHEKSKELDKKSIVVRGQVVKVSQAIMGKNWIHIKDGSGNSSKGTDDITVTSQDVPSVGDIVTAKGTLYRDKDFGMGYFYAVIVEETSISK